MEDFSDGELKAYSQLYACIRGVFTSVSEIVEEGLKWLLRCKVREAREMREGSPASSEDTDHEGSDTSTEDGEPSDSDSDDTVGGDSLICSNPHGGEAGDPRDLSQYPDE